MRTIARPSGFTEISGSVYAPIKRGEKCVVALLFNMTACPHCMGVQKVRRVAMFKSQGLRAAETEGLV